MISVLGFILIIVMAVITYRTAKDYERNPIVWSLISLAVGIGVQIILPGFVIILIAIAMAISGSPAQAVENQIPFATITIVCIILSLVAGFLIIRHVAKILEDGGAPPVPPPNFN